MATGTQENAVLHPLGTGMETKFFIHLQDEVVKGYSK